MQEQWKAALDFPSRLTGTGTIHYVYFQSEPVCVFVPSHISCTSYPWRFCLPCPVQYSYLPLDFYTHLSHEKSHFRRFFSIFHMDPDLNLTLTQCFECLNVQKNVNHALVDTSKYCWDDEGNMFCMNSLIWQIHSFTMFPHYAYKKCNSGCNTLAQI